MRIVLLSDNIPPEHNGGAEKVAWALATGLHRTGYDVHVITATKKASFEEIREGINTYHLHVDYPLRFQFWASIANPQITGQMSKLLKRIKPDVLHAHNIHHNLSYNSLRQAKQLGIPVVVTAHDAMAVAYGKMTHFIDPSRHDVYTPSSDDYRVFAFHNLIHARLRYNPIRNIGIRYALKHYTSARIAVSDALRQALEANNLPPYHVVHNGLEPVSSVSVEVKEALRSRLELAEMRVILMAGRVTREKGIVQVLDAMQQLVQRIPNAVLLILTRNSFKNAIFALPKYKALLENHVRFGGWLSGEELNAAYELADIVTVPSVYLEPFAMINLEGMAASKPLISTCFGGAREIVQDGITGYVINPFDTATFVDRLEQLLTDNALAQRMGAAGYKRFMEHFTLAHQVERTLAVYEQVV
jgi:glycosyltransferase involved in cell wall biosynthesis